MLETLKLFKNCTVNSVEYENARQTLFAAGVRTHVDEARGLVIFNVPHNKQAMNNKYVTECNGLIASTTDWTPVVIPVPNMQYNINTQAVNAFMSQNLYNIYLANDGTIVNFYYHNNQWCISTTNGIHMNNTMFHGISYQAAFTESLAHVSQQVANATVAYEAFVAQLDTSASYTFGFKHPLFHPFREHRNSMYNVWFVQAIRRDGTAVAAANIPTVAAQTQITRSRMNQLYNEAGAAYSNYASYVAQQLRQSSSASETSSAAASNAASSSQKPADARPPPIVYGFILRTKDASVTKEHSHLFVESSLMRKIRRYCYDQSRTKVAVDANLDRETYQHMSAYMNQESYYEYTILFPEVKLIFDKFAFNLAAVTDIIYQVIVAVAPATPAPSNTTTAAPSNTPTAAANADTPSQDIANLATIVRSKYAGDFAKLDKSAAVATIKMTLLNPEMIFIMYPILNAPLSLKDF